jgi:DNA-binding CsgD family transcriptional regulator
MTAVELKEQIEAEREGRPFLVHRSEDGSQQITPITPETKEVWVGRREPAQIRLGWDKEVSSLHAQIEIVGDLCTLVDDGLSRNGSFVNGERVRGRQLLQDGDMLRFGKTLILYRSPLESMESDESTVLAEDAPAHEAVSPAQLRVLVALCRPYKDSTSFATPATNQQIATELHLSVDAVKTHLRALFSRFDVGDLPQNQKRVALVQRALQSGLVSDRDL